MAYALRVWILLSTSPARYHGATISMADRFAALHLLLLYLTACGLQM